MIFRGFAAALWTRKRLAWIYWRRGRRKAADPADGLDEDERYFLQTHGAAMVACMVGWLVCAMFASVAMNWTFYYLLALAAAGRDIIRARATAYAKARTLAAREAAAA